MGKSLWEDQENRTAEKYCVKSLGLHHSSGGIEQCQYTMGAVLKLHLLERTCDFGNGLSQMEKY